MGGREGRIAFLEGGGGPGVGLSIVAGALNLTEIGAWMGLATVSVLIHNLPSR